MGASREIGDPPAPWGHPAGNGMTSMRPPEKPIRGQSLVEFALVLPVMLLLLVGTVEFGRAWMTRNILTGASREAVRIAAVQGNAASARSRAVGILASAGISGAAVSVLDDGTPYGTCSVTVSYNFPVSIVGFLPGLAGKTLPLSTSTSMRKEF